MGEALTTGRNISGIEGREHHLRVEERRRINEAAKVKASS